MKQLCAILGRTRGRSVVSTPTPLTDTLDLARSRCMESSYMIPSVSNIVRTTLTAIHVTTEPKVQPAQIATGVSSCLETDVVSHLHR